MTEEAADPLHSLIEQACERYGLLEGASSILVAVSGGQDSVALLHALVSMQVAREVAALHVHHGLREGEADADEALVRRLCEELSVRCHVVRRCIAEEAEASGRNIEQAGRFARYEECERTAYEHGYQRIATAHTGTDRAETLLLNLFRGAGLRGLRSIPPMRGRIIRPLILVARRQTADYCRRHGLEFRIDRSNLDPDYARRNAVRHEIMPAIEQRFPGAESALLRACEAIEEELAWTEPVLRHWLEEATVAKSAKRLEMDAGRLSTLETGALNRLMRLALERVRGNLEGISREQIERAGKLVGAETGAKVELAGALRVRKEYGRVIIEPDVAVADLPAECVTLPVPGEACLQRRGVRVVAEPGEAPQDFAADDRCTVWIDENAAAEGLVLRSIEPGDRFEPLGMMGSTKLSDFFINERIPRRRRAQIPVVAGPDGRILWVVGQRLAEPARVRDRRRAVRLSAIFDERAWTGVKEDA